MSEQRTTASRRQPSWLLDETELEAGGAGQWVFSDSSRFQEALSAAGWDSRQLGSVYTLEHDVPIGGGRHLHVTEFFTASSWLRRPRRAVLFLSGAAFKANIWSIPVEGYNAAEMVAQHGMFAFTVDNLGVGKSFIPADGRDATLEANTEALRIVIEYIRYFRDVPKMDIIGDGSGGSMGCYLAADADRVSSCVMSAMLYKYKVGGPTSSKELHEALTSSPNGYMPIPAEAYGVFLKDSPPEVCEYFTETQPGDYPVPAIQVAVEDLPFFDPGVARAPGLVLVGTEDPVVGSTDNQELAADYGPDGARLGLLEGAGHVPRVESPEAADWFWTEVFRFLEV